jgi:hypothetical protein
MRRSLPLLAIVFLPRVLAAQGVTTAAIQGTVTGEDGSPVAGATVRVTHALDGRRWEARTRTAGGYLFEDVAVGGPYRIEVHALGFAAEARAGFLLALGARLVVDFTLQPAAVELSSVTINATADPVLSPSRTGPAEIVSATRIAALPNLGRDFLTLTILSPQTAISPSSGSAPSGGIAIAGQNRLLNAFQIDGGVNHDLYTGRLPGRETLPRPMSLEALEEIQVLAAPLDVRYGGFAGGLVNAVTKAGTNAVHGSVFGFLADGVLVGRSAAGDRVGDFTTWQYGGTIGGPIVRDRAHYFLSVDQQHRVVPDPGPLISDTAGGADLALIGIRYASATRFQDVLRNTYGVEPGTLGPSNGRVPATDVFGKVTVQLGVNNHVEVSHHHTDGDRAGFIARLFGQYNLSSLSRRDPSTVNASRLIWTSLLGGRWSNELIASYLRLRDGCQPTATYPLIRANADRGRLLAGTPNMCPSSFVQEAYELTDNLTIGVGTHVVTLGTHAELLSFEDNQMNGRAGLWDFRNLDSLAAGRAFHYDRTLPGSSGGAAVAFRARQIGLYGQDRWKPRRTLTVTAGLRIDVPVLPDGVARNGSLKAALGLDTGRPPSGKLLWSPRLGINYDVHGAGRTFLRGGVGLFSGRPPFGWFGAAYRDDGTHELVLSCDGAEVRPFDPFNQPATCVSGAGPVPRLTFFEPDVRFPQSLKVSLGLDHRLPRDVVGTVDLLYTRAAHQLYLSDANLPSPIGAAWGEGGRALYGTIGAAGFATPARRASTLGQVVRVSNRNGDRTVALSAQVRKRFGEGAEARALYAHTRAWDRMSIPNARAFANLGVTPLDGTLADRRLRTSYFEIPHRVELSVALRLPNRLRLSVLYAGASGTPYTYIIAGDANADGIGVSNFNNDVVYVPRSRLDIALDGNGSSSGVGTAAQQDSVYVLLDAFIRAEPCLNGQRGRIMVRNNCRNPWFGTLNARLTKAFQTVGGHSLELAADLYNVLNLISREWGQSRVTTLNPGVPLLQLAGYDASAERGIYRVQLPGLRQVQDLASRWQLELSARYVY